MHESGDIPSLNEIDYLDNLSLQVNVVIRSLLSSLRLNIKNIFVHFLPLGINYYNFFVL